MSFANKKYLVFFGLFVFLFFIPEISFAKTGLDSVNVAFESGAKKWNAGGVITGYAESLFWKLVLIDFTWTTIVWVKDRKEFGEILTGYVGKILTIGFFWALLKSGSEWIPAIINSFSQIGKEAATTQGADVSTLDSVFWTGIDLAGTLVETLAELSVLERIAFMIPTTAACIIAACGFALIAGQLLVALVESYIAIYGGIIMLGFGGSRWTSEMASSYLKFGIGAGLKLMLCYMVVGLGFAVFNTVLVQSSAMLTNPLQFLPYLFRIIALTLIYVYIVFNVPGLASAMMSGAPNMSLGGMVGAGLTAAAGVAGAGAAAMALGGGGAAGAAKSALGDVAKGGLPGGGGGPGAAANALNGGGGSGGVQPPGSGLGTTPSNMPGMPKSGPIATSLANDAAANESANTPQTGDSSGSSFVGPQAPTSVAPSSLIISTDTNIGNAKAAASSAPAAPVPAAKAGGVAAPAGSPSSAVSPAAADSSSVSSPSGTSPASTSGGEQGDASGASVGADHPHTALLTAISENMAKMANGPEQVRSVSEKIDQMRKYVPNDGASISTPGISMGHTKD